MSRHEQVGLAVRKRWPEAPARTGAFDCASLYLDRHRNQNISNPGLKISVYGGKHESDINRLVASPAG